MTRHDFDFKIGRGHYRGTGMRGLVALAIIHVPRATFAGGALLGARYGLPWAWELVRAHFPL